MERIESAKARSVAALQGLQRTLGWLNVLGAGELPVNLELIHEMDDPVVPIDTSLQ